MKKITIIKIEKARQKQLKLQKEYDLLSLHDKIFSPLADKLNRAISEYKRLKKIGFYIGI